MTLDMRKVTPDMRSVGMGGRGTPGERTQRQTFCGQSLPPAWRQEASSGRRSWAGPAFLPRWAERNEMHLGPLRLCAESAKRV